MHMSYDGSRIKGLRVAADPGERVLSLGSCARDTDRHLDV